MITTIQLSESVKRELERMKDSRSKSYEDVIISLIKIAEEKKRKQTDLLIESCKVMAEDSLRITKEWETTDASIDWEW